MRRIQGSAIKKNILVDINNYIHRVYYSFKDTIPKPGELTARVVNLLGQSLRDVKPFDSVNIFLDGKSQKRLSLSGDYKQHRPKLNILGEKFVRPLIDGTEVESEHGFLKLIFRRLGCDVYHDLSSEADDLIASFCKLRNDEINIIISDDKDLFQLLSNQRTVIYRPGNSDHFVDADKSELVWSALNRGTHPRVKPTQIRMFKALCGDSSDNIKGIPRFNKSTAVKLSDFESPSALLASDLSILSEAERIKVNEHGDLLKLNYDLVGLDSDIDISLHKTNSDVNHKLVKDIFYHDVSSYVSIYNYEIESQGPIKSNNLEVFLPDWYNEL